MSTRRLYVAPDRLASDSLVLTEAEQRHLVRVLRLGGGDRVVVFDGQGHEVDAELAEQGGPARLLLGARRTVPLPAGSRVVLLQGVARGERMDLVVQKTTELGVATIVPVLTARCVPQPRASGGHRLERWRRIASESARQCGRADVPEVQSPVSLTEALSAVTAAVRLALWEVEHERSLRATLSTAQLPSTVALLIGPEGGLEPSEADEAQASGFQLVGLGPRILRTETAAVVALALVQSASGAFE